MNKLSFAVAVGFCTFGLLLAAQEVPAHAPDGGTQERLQSIDILPVTNAPFTATVVTEWIKMLPDGSTQTIKNHRTVARDGSGRVFQERRVFSPNGDQQATPLSELDYLDTNRHELYICRPETHVCVVNKVDRPTTIRLPKEGTLPNGRGSVTREDLGRKTFEGLDLFGSREVTTINAGVVGNQRSEPTVKEFWYSPHLQINVITKRFDPYVSSSQNFEVKNINLDPPDPKMFEVPSGYRLVKMDDQ